MSFDKNDVVSVATLSGEFVGKFVSATEAGVTLKDPKMLVAGQEEGSMGFARGICLTGIENPPELLLSAGGVIFTVKTNEEIVKAYRQATSGLII
mgnify:CR=1 FL=1|jgi:hypothetical protein